MLDFLLLIGLFAILGTGYLTWELGRKNDRRSLPGVPVRRREDARDWQRRFGADSLLAANFLQPTQNEILETLCVLDHLTPGWEMGHDESVENHFLHELALNFPTLLKSHGAYPLPFAESLAAWRLTGSGKKKQPATEEEVATRRESFRNSRAQLNALEQIVAGAPVGPVSVTPGSLPFRVTDNGSHRRAWNPWPARFAWAAATIAVFLAITYFLDRTPGMKADPISRVEPSISPATVAVFGTPAPETPAAVEIAAAAASPASTPVSVAIATPATVLAPPASPAARLPAVNIALNSQIAASQQRAVGKYPDLAVEGSEINLRFVFRYKNLVQENSPRLHDPNWPEQLAEECAAAAGATAKRNRLAQVSVTNH